jgi:hypothetical protein
MTQHRDLGKAARKGVLTGEVAGAAAIDNVEGANGSLVGEAAPSSTS